MLKNRDQGLDSMSENIRYNYLIKEMAKHIIYGDLNLNFRNNKI